VIWAVVQQSEAFVTYICGGGVESLFAEEKLRRHFLPFQDFPMFASSQIKEVTPGVKPPFLAVKAPQRRFFLSHSP